MGEPPDVVVVGREYVIVCTGNDGGPNRMEGQAESVGWIRMVAAAGIGSSDGGFDVSA